MPEKQLGRLTGLPVVATKDDFRLRQADCKTFSFARAETIVFDQTQKNIAVNLIVSDLDDWAGLGEVHYFADTRGMALARH
jgi:hypothetical protein